MKMNSKIGIGFMSALATGMLFASSGVAFADTASTQGNHWGERPPGVFGIVQSISGSTLSVQSQMPGEGTSAATYSVNASGATVTKNGAASSLSAVATGDRVMVEGTVSGTSVTATAVHDGMPQGGREGMRGGPGAWGNASSTRGMPMMEGAAMPQGNGQPVIGGTVSSVNGSTISLANKGNTTYTVDASSATVFKNNATSSIGNVATGDSIIVQGSVNGTSVTASSVIDHGAAPTSSSQDTQHGIGGFMGAIGGLFHRLFGFF